MNFFKTKITEVRKKRFSVTEGLKVDGKNYVRIKITPGSFTTNDGDIFIKIEDINSFIADIRANVYHLDRLEMEMEL